MRSVITYFSFIIAITTLSFSGYSQAITITQLTGGVSASPLANTDTDVAIFGLEFSKAGGGTNSISAISIILDQNPVGRFTNPRLVRSSNNNSFDAADLSNEVGTPAFGPLAINFTGGITTFSGSSGAEVRRFFLVVDVDNSVNSTTTAVTPSITEANVTAAGTVNTVSITGTTFGFADVITPGFTFNPLNAATNVAINSNIVITFDEAVFQTDGSAIDAAAIEAGIVELKVTNDAGAAVAFTATFNGTNQITINPDADLANNTTYYVELNPVEDADGNETTQSSITFSTPDTIAPNFSFNITNGATGVPETTQIIITFNEPVRKLDDGVITSGDLNTLVELKLTDNAGVAVPFTATINGPKTIITVTPSSNLAGNTLYYAEMNPVEDGGNNATTASSITFTTGDSLPPDVTFNPANGATNVSVVGNISINFSEPIRKINDDPIADIDIAGLVELKVTNDAGAAVPFTGTINAGKTSITINPDSPLTASTGYYVELAPIEDGAGNATVQEDITFTTEAAPAITSYSSDPTCMGETITINGTGFGLSTPTVTVNGISVTPLANTNTTITIVVPTTTTGDATVIVTNTTNGLSDSSSSLTLKNPIAATLPITTDPATPTATFPFDVDVANTQTGVNYAIAEVPPGTYGSTTPGNGAIVSFGPYTKATAGTYNFQIRATSAGCTNRVYPLAVTILSLLADAGPDKIMCKGDTISIGGTPTGSGGTGFHQITWTASPPDPSLTGQANFSNPLVSPTVTTTYTVTVDDSSPATPSIDQIVVTVNQPTNQSLLDIQLTPPKPNNTYQKTDDPVELTYTLGGTPAPFTGNTRFEGPGVNSTGAQKYFYPQAGNVGLNELILLFENPEGCITRDTAIVFVRDNNQFLNGLDLQYCQGELDNNLTIQSPITFNPIKFSFGIFGTFYFPGYRYTYQPGPANVRLRNVDTNILISTPGAFTVSGSGSKDIDLNTDLTGSGNLSFEIAYLIENLAYNDADPANPLVVASSTEFLGIGFGVIGKPLIVNNMPPSVCVNEAPFTLNVSPSGGTFVLNGSSSTAIFDPGTLGLPDTNTIIYTYNDPSTSCTNSISHNLTLNRVPDIDILFSNGCQNELIDFTPNFTGPMPPFEYNWDTTGDGLADYTFANNTPQVVYGRYPIPSNYNITLNIKTTSGCVESKTEVLTIGETPDLNIDWFNVCDGDITRFVANSNFMDTKFSQLDSVVWSFGDGTLSKKGRPGPFTISDSVATRLYTQTGNYTVIGKLVSDLGCTRYDTVSVYKVKKDTVSGNRHYIESFDSTFVAQGWIAGGTSSSWQWGAPNGVLISDDVTQGGKAWVTNLSGVYNVNEDSWVHSPCINLENLQRPYLRFDFRSLTRAQVDGAVLQYNYKNTTNRENDWIRVDASLSENWYNGTGILSNPGNQNVLQLGWTGLIDSTEWRNALIPLDATLASIPPASRNKVRFRIAFSSSQFIPVSEGFAFDNFEIGQRNRIVLLEQFTNSGGANDLNEPNKVSNQAINNFITSSSGEVIKLEYHVGFPGPGADPLSTTNPADIGARVAFYGVADAPTTFINAQTGNLATIFQRETLKPAGANIDTIFTKPSPSDKLNLQIEWTANELLPANTTMHVAIIEDPVNQPAALGTNGETVFRSVVRKLLPNAVGTVYAQPIPKDSSRIVNLSWVPQALDFNNLGALVFLQNPTTKEIYQAQLLYPLTNVPPPSVITSIEDIAEYIQIYPNPANESFEIELPTQAENRLMVNLIDPVGRAAQQLYFEKGEQTKTVNTQNLAQGIYVVQIGSGKTGVVRKKVLVVH